MSTVPKEIDAVSLADLKAFVAIKEQAEMDVLQTEIAALESTLGAKEHQLAQLTGMPGPARRGRKPRKSFTPMANQPAKKGKKGKGTRTPIKPTVMAYMEKHGSASPADIVNIHAELNMAA